MSYCTVVARTVSQTIGINFRAYLQSKRDVYAFHLAKNIRNLALAQADKIP